jgi:Asp-tRNA(Asn)/Glu-tRNA(Gln) amidotransferase A subunit family amidase
MIPQIVTQHEASRRNFLAYFSAIGLSSTLFPGVLWARFQEREASKITAEMIKSAAAVAGQELSEDEITGMVEGVNRNLASLEELRAMHFDNDLAPPIYFSPLVPGMVVDRTRRPFRQSKTTVADRPSNLEDVAFWPVTHLAQLVETRQVRSVELTEMYLARLKRYNQKLNCVVTFTEDLAMQQARQADAEISAGKYRGPLHGIPWGCKDIISVAGYKTTWGSATFKDQIFQTDASVVEMLREAGAVLLAKLTTGELAAGDRWFGGRTNNPWDVSRGSSGSSAGPAAATAAGLVGFGIGTETSGSILSPSSVCGVTGLRPTFGRISRHGVMTLSWTQDRLGPLCRTVEDCALVFREICKPDGKDLSVADVPFNWNADLEVRKLRVGYLKDGFEETGKSPVWKANEQKALAQLKELGIELVPFKLPDISTSLFGNLLGVESSAFFDEFARLNRDKELSNRTRRVGRGRSRFVPAVEYLQAQRLRALMMQRLAESVSEFQVYVAPYMEIVGRPESQRQGGPETAPERRRTSPRPTTPTSLQFRMANLAGYPTVSVPNGFNDRGTPTSIIFVGKPYGEADVLALAKAYQDASGWHREHPQLDA